MTVYIRLKMLIRVALLLGGYLWCQQAGAIIEIAASGPSGMARQSVPDEGGSFELNLPLNRNAVNNLTVTATDAQGRSSSAEVAITQVSLNEVVVSEITSERLSVEEVEELVSQGVIQLDNPENYNVSQFDIVLTIDNQPVPISIPVITPTQPAPEEEDTGEETYSLPSGGNGSGGGPPKLPENIDVIIFEEPVSVPADITPSAPIPAIPGVIVVEGKIKSLKEFFSVRLLLMNTSGIFTLANVVANAQFPEGGLTSVLPADGLASFGDILPGNAGQPGQAEREFIIRGDEIGVRDVKVDFGGTITGPGIPATNAIPFNGSAMTELDVRGPPTFQITVLHPDTVYTNQPYDLTVEILNTGQIPAMYASLDMDIGLNARFINVRTDVDPPVTETNRGPQTRTLGHIQPGQMVSSTFRVLPLKEGPLSSCMGLSDQNISLKVIVGNIGCVEGHYPPLTGAPSGVPTVAVTPAANASGIGISAPVVAMFSEVMATNGITTGEGGTFNVYDNDAERVPGILSFDTVGGRTIAAWQVNDGVTYRLKPGEEYTVMIGTNIADMDGNLLFNAWFSTFKTTTTGQGDVDPPTLSLSIEPPVNPNLVLPGERIRVNAYASDQGSGVVRVELRTKDLNSTNQLYQLIDQKTVFEGDSPPYYFTIASEKLDLGHTYQLLGTAYDALGNVRDATIAFIMASDASPPVLVLPESPTNDQLQGISFQLSPVAISGGVHVVRYYLDADTNAYKTVNLPPWQATIRTLTLPLGPHGVRAVAEDGLSQTGEDSYAFNLAENVNLPQVNFGSQPSGGRFVLGNYLSITPNVVDEVGIQSVLVTLDSPTGRVLATAADALVLSTTNLSLGLHRVYVTAVNNLGRTNNLADPSSYWEFELVEPPPGPPPPAPSLTSVSYAENGEVRFSGSSVSLAEITVVNTNLSLRTTTRANDSGSFTGAVGAVAGNILEFSAFDAAHSPYVSSTTRVTVVDSPTLVSLVIAPSQFVLASRNALQDLTAYAGYTNVSGGWTSAVNDKVAWRSDNLAAAAVTANGRVVALARGTAVISVTLSNFVARSTGTIDIVTLTNVVVSPLSMEFATLGQRAHIAVVGQYDNGTQPPLTSGVSFISSDPRVAAVDSSGWVTAVDDGLAQITVYRQGAASRTVTVRVNTGNDPIPDAAIETPLAGTVFQRGDLVAVGVRARDITAGVTRVSIAVTGAVTYSASRTIQPPALDTLQVFNFNVPQDAAVGRPFTVRAWSEDGSANLSATSTVSLLVGDSTPPSVLITGPPAQTVYLPSQMVNVAVSAADAGGLANISVMITGAQTRAFSRDFVPPVGSSNATFSFMVPPDTTEGPMVVYATARDASGNVASNGPLPLAISVGDHTPPETRVASVAAPGTNAAALVTIEITSGAGDADHVELYFRRNGVGTFNRYTDSDRGQPYGFFGATGGIGRILFDSTKMGGDGSYEFYSIGVDTHGNREDIPCATNPPICPDATGVFNAGTVWQWATNDLFIAATNAIYDGLNLAISNAVVTVEGVHTFQNVEIYEGGFLTHPDTDTNHEYGLEVTCWSLSIHTNGAVDVLGRGYRGGCYGSGDYRGHTVSNAPGSTYRSGGSYGGMGGAYDGIPNPTYGNPVMPFDLGSGGSSGTDCDYYGGDGGGRIRLTAINVAVDGRIAAEGATGRNSGNAGSGSGGSVYLIATTLSGRGTISADGGSSQVGGGGGRIAAHYVDMSTLAEGAMHARGGVGSNSSGFDGSVFTKSYLEAGGTLVVDGGGAYTSYAALPVPPGLTFDNVIIRNKAQVIIDQPMVVSNEIAILTGARITHSVGNTNGLDLRARVIRVDGDSAIDVTGRGYRGGRRDGNSLESGETLGGQAGAVARSGGSHAGRGGVYDGPGNTLTYGTPDQADKLGGGGSVGGTASYSGGNGGGRVNLFARDYVHLDGAVLADGQIGDGNAAGSGAGGSVRIESPYAAGTGQISARGGDREVGGGGGRVIILYDYLGGTGDDFDSFRNVSVRGGRGNSVWGTDGSLLIKRRSQTYGDLHIDGYATNAVSSQSFFLPALGFGKNIGVAGQVLMLDGTVPLLPGGWIGTLINPNTAQSRLFVVTGNSSNSLTLQAWGHAQALASVSASGSVCAVVHRYDNVVFRRGGVLVAGDILQVEEELAISDFGSLTHPDATINWEPHLEIEARTATIASNATINVDGRGYLGGRSGNNISLVGRTLGNADGSSPRSGGSFGGLGGVYDGAVGPCPIYGTVAEPIYLGSGGSAGGTSSYSGGDGGGRLTLSVQWLHLDGVISASGDIGGGNAAGSGSGGSILIYADEIAGTGMIKADGGEREVGGGGGRIALYLSADLPTGITVQARGGRGTQSYGGLGTVYIRRNGQPLGDLIIDGQNQSWPWDLTSLPAGESIGNLSLINGATLVMSQPLVVSNRIELRNSSVITHPGQLEAGLSIKATEILIDSNSSINVSGRGYLGGRNGANTNSCGMTLGNLPGSQPRSGGSYGGVGSWYDGAAGPGPVYGQPDEPVYLGSGGSIGGSASYPGGNGGGRVRIEAGTLVVDGQVNANGAMGAENWAGSGSGGSIWIKAGLVRGSGLITANGGANDSGGGGGRILVEYGSLGGTNDDLNGTRNIQAYGGHPEGWGSAGTVLLKGPGAQYGDLVIDDGLTSGTGAATPLTKVGSGTISWVSNDVVGVAGTIPWLPGGLVGQWVLAGTQTLEVVVNTDHELKLGESSGQALATALTNGTPIVGLHGRFDNLVLRGGGNISSVDRLWVPGWIRLAERSAATFDELATATTGIFVSGSSYITHSTSLESGLQLKAPLIEIETNSSINVSGRGYLGGRNGANTNSCGMTLGNLPGSQPRSGGSYGGVGSWYDGAAGPGPVYGQPDEPVYLGSGGSIGGSASYPGGNGGGRVRIEAGTLVVDGQVNANGAMGAENWAGSGSGGSIWIKAGLVRGSGLITANGGANDSGGGGGRILVEYGSLGGTNDDLNGTRNIQAYGGHPEGWGSAGTVLLKGPGAQYGDLVIDDGLTSGTGAATPLTMLGFGCVQGLTADTFVPDGGVYFGSSMLKGLEINPNLSQSQTFEVVDNSCTSIVVRAAGATNLASVSSNLAAYAGVYRFDNLTIRGGGNLVAGDKLVVYGRLSVVERGFLTHPEATTNFEPRLDVVVGELNLASDGTIDVSGRGYLGGRRTGNPFDEGRTAGNAFGSTYRSAGSYGGLGAAQEGAPGPVFGSSTNPAVLGAGGSAGASQYAGGDGGGWVRIVANSMVLNGRIYALGYGGSGNLAGSGSGGSIYLAATSVVGTGYIRANAGDGQLGGGGGRIALFHAGTPDSVTNLTLSAAGGLGSTLSGSTGTVYISGSYLPPADGIFPPAFGLFSALRRVPVLAALTKQSDGSWKVVIESAVSPSSVTRNLSANNLMFLEFSTNLLSGVWSEIGPISTTEQVFTLIGEPRNGFIRVRIDDGLP